MIQFADPVTTTRRTIRLGKMTKREAESFKLKLERLIFCKTTRTTPEQEVSEWVAALDSRTADKLSEWGLIAQRKASEDAPRLEAFLDSCFAKRSDVKEATQTVYRRVRRHLVQFFGADKPITSVTPGDADDWWLYLKNEGLAENTARRHVGIARQFFKVALRHRIIDENPFADLKASVVPNASRFYFLTVADTHKLIAACNTVEWRLIIALARFGGLRTPSETLALKWQHVNWETNRITVQSPKTEHHQGHATRVIPIFTELRPFLQEAWDAADVGATFVIEGYRNPKQNLRTQFERIINRAGLNPWPKLFQNLRSSRETELGELFPIQVVTSWLGNSEIVARKHYLQVTDDHFDRATEGDNSALQKAQQRLPTTSGNELQTANRQTSESTALHVVASVSDQMQSCTVGGTGPEHIDATINSEETLRIQRLSSAAKSAALSALLDEMPESERLAFIAKFLNAK